jgi:tRNA(Ile)-lysidine synthase
MSKQIEEQHLEVKFKESIVTNKLWKQQDLLLLACSGGLDSVALAWLLKNSGFSFEILHCNFNLRGEESNRDEEFVRSLAAQFKVNFHVKSFSTKEEMVLLGKGVQETARILRYRWFEEIVNEKKSLGTNALVLLAHHSDDQVETMAMNFFRGTGIAGLIGMKSKLNHLVRPLLPFSRKQLAEYAAEHSINWVEDSSNADDHYTRNFFRLEVLPMIREVFPAVNNNLLENGKRFSEINHIYQVHLEKTIKKLLLKNDIGWKIPVRKLMNIVPLDTMLFEVFGKFGFTVEQCMEIKKLFLASTGKSMTSKSHVVLKNRDWLLITPLSEVKNKLVVIPEDANEITFGDRIMLIKEVIVENFNKTDDQLAYINKSELSFPLILRPWKEGDFFYPLGMKKKKKVSRFMIDIKLSKFEKDQQWVLESDKKIIWVVGRRIDDRFRVRSLNDKVLMFKY